MDYEYNEYEDYIQDQDYSEPMIEEAYNSPPELQEQVEPPPQMKKAPSIHRRKSIVDVRDVCDPSRDSLSKSSVNGSLIEFLDDPNQVLSRLSELYMYIMTLIDIAQKDGCRNNQLFQVLAYEVDLEILLTLFFQGLHVAQHTDIKLQTNNQVISLPLDKVRLLSTLKSIITKCTCRQKTRQCLIRLLTFYCLPQKYFVFGITPQDCQQIIMSKLSQHYNENNDEFDALDLELTASVFLCNVNATIEQVKSIIWIMNIYLESILESEYQSHKTNAQILIIIKLFAVFTLNKQIQQYFLQQRLHILLYNTLKFSTPIFSNKVQGVHFEDQVRNVMVILIGQISSSNNQDDRFAQMLYSDLLIIIDQQSFGYANEVINPLLNVKSEQSSFVCFHTESKFSELWNIRKMMDRTLELKQMYGQEVAELIKIQLDTEILPLKFKLEFLKIFCQNWVPLKQKNKLQKNHAIIQNDSDKIIDEQIFEEVPMEPSASVLKQQQNQIKTPNIQGNWMPLHKFSLQNPILSSQHFFEIANQKNFLLFVFELQQELKRIQICVYTDKTMKLEQGQRYKVSKRSFYCIGFEDIFQVIPLNNQKEKTLFEITHNNITFKCDQNRFLTIDFQNLSGCRLLLPSSSKIKLKDDNVTLIKAEIFQFNQNQTNPQISDDQLNLLNQIDSYDRLIQQALFYTRLSPVKRISSSVRVGDVRDSLRQKYQKSLTLCNNEQQVVDDTKTLEELQDPFVIVDLHVQTLQIDANTLQLPPIQHDQKIERPLRNQFIRIQGFEKLALKLRQNLLKSGKFTKEYFIDFVEWTSIQDFAQYISVEEDLLLRFLMIYKEVHQMFHQGTYMLYKSLNNYLKKSLPLIKFQIMNSQLFDSLLLRVITYLKKLVHDTLPKDHGPRYMPETYELKDVFQGVKPSKGKPKGIGYGDSNYNANLFQSKTISKVEEMRNLEGKALNSESAAEYQDLIIGEIFSIIYQIFSSIEMLEEEINHIFNSNILVVMRTILYVKTVSEMIQNHQIFLPIIKLLGILAERDSLIELFVQENSENLSLYRILQNLVLQTQLILDNNFSRDQRVDKIQFINVIKGVAMFVEQRLVQNRMVEIRYTKKEEQKVDLEDKLNLHQFYTQLMKPLAVKDVQLLHIDQQWVAKMGVYPANGIDNPAKINRIIQELSELADNLPIEATNSIFLRYDQQKMDCMRFIIFGATGTPYAHGAFQYEMLFNQDYPNRPPKVLLTTTGYGKFRFNPNLYSCGKVCLSLLGTWGDNWIANVSTILQILISIMSMVMSEYVLFNEPGWENLVGTDDGERKNRGYCNLVKLNNIRFAMIDQLRKPPLGFEDVIRKSFFLKKNIIMKEIEGWIREADLPANYQNSQNNCNYQQNSHQYKADLIEAYEQLKVELIKLTNIDNTFQDSTTSGFVRNTVIVNKQFSQLVQREQLNRMQWELQLPMPEKIEIDTQYEADIQQKAFDPNSQDVQNLMSRYIGVLGVDAVSKQSQASVLIYGLDGLGVEIAKNIVLSGVRRLTVVDDKLCSRYDQCGQFYIWEEDINSPRSLATIKKLKHLNPYVLVDFIEEKYLAQSIKNYNIMVISNQENFLDLVNICNENSVAVILTQTHSVFGRIITDFGDTFVSNDPTGESIVALNIENIDEYGQVTLIKGQKHNLQDGDFVQIQEVKEIDEGKESWNQVYQITQVQLRQFQLLTTKSQNNYQGGGLVIQQKMKKEFKFERIHKILQNPVYSEWMEPVSDDRQIFKRDFIHFLLSQRYDHQDPWNFETLEDKMNRVIKEFFIQKQIQSVDYLESILPILALYILTAGGRLPPLEAYLGGLVSQEVLKYITQKYSPIQQVYIKCFENVLPYDNLIEFLHLDDDDNVHVDVVKGQEFTKKFQFIDLAVLDRVKPIQILLGKRQVEKIEQSRLFMVGAGAIGCELLKNFAMCGFSTKGCVYVTDPDIIENSNLNRQFLFRSKHLRKPKSVTAAAAVQQMNPYMRVIPRLDKVGPQTSDVYHSHFFSTLDAVANALDNVQARLYVDSKCVESEIPLVESGTLGPKGHVQVIIPHQTESYGSKQDPEETNDIPYCTLKMFPESELHCMEWARDKFESYFQRKPQALCQLLLALQSFDARQSLKSIQQQQLEVALRQIKKIPRSIEDCISRGRLKFEKLFSTSIKQLLEAYPLDTKDANGKLFWSAPKRPPSPLNFDGLQIGLEFVRDFAILTAQNYSIPFNRDGLLEHVSKVCQGVIVPEYHSSEEKLNSLKNQLKPIEQQQVQVRSIEDVIDDVFRISSKLDELRKAPLPIEFEKDDDTNHHVSFITSATNSRSLNYQLKQVDWLWCKLKAGRIVPAMATTTSCISALQTIELIKVLQKQKPLHEYSNTFLNMAIPLIMVSEPALNEKIKLPSNIEYSIWTKHIFQMQYKDQKIYELLYYVEKELGVRIQQLSQGKRAFFVRKMLPSLLQDQETLYNTPILDFIQVKNHDTYVDLSCTIELHQEIQGPKIRIIFK